VRNKILIVPRNNAGKTGTFFFGSYYLFIPEPPDERQLLITSQSSEIVIGYFDVIYFFWA